MGILVEPPTRTTSSTSEGLRPASARACFTGAIVFCTMSPIFIGILSLIRSQTLRPCSVRLNFRIPKPAAKGTTMVIVEDGVSVATVQDRIDALLPVLPAALALRML